MYNLQTVTMKKLFLFGMFLLTMTFAWAQSVPRQMVAVEDATGTWCQYCPGAQMGTNDLLSNGKSVAVIANHTGDSYTNTYSTNRLNLYNIQYLPGITFDGNLGYEGGSNTQSMYSVYLPRYNASIATPSPIALSIEITHTGLAYTAVITITKVGTVPTSNTALFFFVTQSDIHQNWQGQTHLEHVNRLMVPGASGTAVNFSSGDIQTVTLNFNMNSAWPIDDCEFIALFQNTVAGQGSISGMTGAHKHVIYQCIKRGAIDLTPDFTVPSTIVAKGTPVMYTNTTSGGYIGVPESYEWIFPGGFPASSTLENPIVIYNSCGAYDVTLIVNRGGQIDTLTRPAYIQVGPQVNVTANPGFTACWYQTITLDATTEGATSYLWMPGGETTPSIDVTYAQYGIGTHDFTVTVNTDACEIVKTVSASFDACTGTGDKSKEVTFSVYPNPGDGDFTLDVRAAKLTVADLVITNNLGMTVYEEKSLVISNKLRKDIKLSSLSSGIYFLTLRNNEMKVVQKILVK
jgi:PKD repeat protein